MVKGKKAVFYILMSVTIMGIIVASMLVFANRFKKLESSSIEIVRNEFVGTTVSDISAGGLDRFMDVASKRALVEISEYKAAGNTIADPESAFDMLVKEGILNNTPRYLTPTLNKFLGVAANYYFVLGFNIEKLTINSTFSQTDPWHIQISSDIQYKVNIPRTKFLGVIDRVVSTNISVFGLTDPAGGWRISKSWDQNDTFPSYVDRLEGKTTGSEQGICRVC